MTLSATRPYLLLAAIISLAIADGAATIGLHLLARRGLPYPPLHPADLPAQSREIVEHALGDQPSYLQLDSELGWRVRPGATGLGGTPRALPDGRREPQGRGSVAAFGDSFTHGTGVEDAEAWAALVGADNYGVPGYGLDQAYLHYLAVRPDADTVLIGFMSENIRRAVNVYRPFYVTSTRLPFAKPRFTLDRRDSLILLPNPLPTADAYRALLRRPDSVLARLGEADAHWHRRWHRSRWDVLAPVQLAKLAYETLSAPEYYDPSAEPFRVTVAVFDAFVRAVRTDGATPVILLFPNAGDLRDGLSYPALRDTLTARGHPVLDLADAFRDCGECPAMFRGHHYSAAGNSRVAADLRRRLMHRGSGQ